MKSSVPDDRLDRNVLLAMAIAVAFPVVALLVLPACLNPVAPQCQESLRTLVTEHPWLLAAGFAFVVLVWAMRIVLQLVLPIYRALRQRKGKQALGASPAS